MLDAWKDLQVLRQLRGVHFDFVFELSEGHRGRLFETLTRSDRRYSIKLKAPLNAWERWRLTGASTFDGLASHRVERDYRTVAEFLTLPHDIPALVFERNRTEPWHEGAHLTNFSVMQIGTRKEDNRWSREKWREVAAHLLTVSGHVVISSGPSEREVAEGGLAAKGTGAGRHPDAGPDDLGASRGTALPGAALRRPEHGGDAPGGSLCMSHRGVVRPNIRRALVSVARELSHCLRPGQQRGRRRRGTPATQSRPPDGEHRTRASHRGVPGDDAAEPGPKRTDQACLRTAAG